MTILTGLAIIAAVLLGAALVHRNWRRRLWALIVLVANLAFLAAGFAMLLPIGFVLIWTWRTWDMVKTIGVGDLPSFDAIENSWNLLIGRADR